MHKVPWNNKYKTTIKKIKRALEIYKKNVESQKIYIKKLLKYLHLKNMKQ